MPNRRELLSAALMLPALAWSQPQQHLNLRVPGMVWQPDNATARPEGEWQRLGIDTLLIQWLATDDGAGHVWKVPALEQLRG